MRKAAAAATALLAAGACRSTPEGGRDRRAALDATMPGYDAQSRALDPRPGDVRLAADVLVRPLGNGLWMHVTLQRMPDGSHYPANGLLLETAGGGMVLFDTGWNDRQASAILDWSAGALRRPVRDAVVTHFHEDRLGGIRALRARGVPVRALAATAALARRDSLPAPDSVPGLATAARADAAGFELFFPGAGHAPDNIVAWFPAQGVLFGGCLVKADTATTVGNVADADVPGWPAAVARVRAAYPGVRQVVPGHGAVSGAGALAWTERLVREKGRPAAR